MNAIEVRKQAQRVAGTIKQQIGVWPLAEVGARDFVAHPDGLTFTCKPKSRLYRVTVKLNAADLYDIHMMRTTSPYTHVKVAKDADFSSLPTIIRNLGDLI